MRETLQRLGLWRPGLGWYEWTRHTFASQWVLSGGAIEKLKEMMGHYSVVVTERYSHLRPDLFTPGDHATLKVNMRPAKASIEAISGAVVRGGGTVSESPSCNRAGLLKEEEKKVGAAL